MRHGGNRSEAEHGSSDLGIHFVNSGIENMNLQIIDCVTEDFSVQICFGFCYDNIYSRFLSSVVTCISMKMEADGLQNMSEN